MKPLRILIAEDDSLTALLLQTLCERHAHEVVVQSDGQAAWAFLEECHDVDVVLLDLLLPLMSGYTILERIRQSPHLSSCQVVVITAKDQLNDQRHVLSLGANAYWSKPFDPDALLQAIEQMCWTAQVV